MVKANVRDHDDFGSSWHGNRYTRLSISVADVGGDFIVQHDGSGGIDYENVRGRIDIPKRRR